MPLNKIKSKKKLVWTEEMEESFIKIKEAFQEVSGHLVLDKETMTYPGVAGGLLQSIPWNHNLLKKSLGGATNHLQPPPVSTYVPLL